MIYTEIVLLALVIAILLDIYGTKTRILTRGAFWTSYAIILPFQLLTNWWLTSRQIVIYNQDAIVGTRIASAPIEDLVFGFALILSVLSLWVYQGKRQ